MAFVLRPNRRFPVVISATYEHWLREGEGIVWNLSSTGWRLSGDLPLALGDICSLAVMLPTNKSILVAAGAVRWVRGEEFGIETLMMDGNAQAQLGKYIRQRMRAV